MLESLDITVEEVRAQVARIVGQGDEVTTGQIPFTPRAKKAPRAGAARKALSLGRRRYIGTRRTLLARAPCRRERRAVAMRVLLEFDADADTIRNEVIRMLLGAGLDRVTGASRRHRARAYVDGARSRAVPKRTPLASLRWWCSAVSFPFGLLVGWLIWG